MKPYFLCFPRVNLDGLAWAMSQVSDKPYALLCSSANLELRGELLTSEKLPLSELLRKFDHGQATVLTLEEIDDYIVFRDGTSRLTTETVVSRLDGRSAVILDDKSAPIKSMDGFYYIGLAEEVSPSF
jgi:hypothetical protein